jgi:hypothetical protein
MAVDVIALIQKQKLTSIKRSISAAESHEARVSHNAARATAIVAGKSPFAGKEHFEEYVLRDIYMRTLEEYERKPNHAYTGQPFTPRGLALWRRVAACWKTSGVDPETYVRAQFTYFHNAFRKAPTAQQLATDAAVVRAASVVVTKVTTNNIPATIDTADLFRCCEKQMSDVMRAQKMTREEVYRKLVMPGFLSFPEKYLNADPVWKQLQSK